MGERREGEGGILRKREETQKKNKMELCADGMHTPKKRQDGSHVKKNFHIQRGTPHKVGWRSGIVHNASPFIGGRRALFPRGLSETPESTSLA